MPGTTGCRMDTLQARRVLAGWTVSELARRATVSDWLVEQLENGGNCSGAEAQRVLDALGGSPVALASNTQANPTVFTVTAGHLFQTGDTVTLAGVTGANADPNGSRVVTRINGTTFSVSIDCSTAGGTGGTATIDGASVGLARL